MRREADTGMLTGKIKVIFLLFVFILLSCEASNKPNEEIANKAWWLSVEFDPSESDIKGIPVSKVNPKWKQALVLNSVYFKHHITETDYAYIQNSNLNFEIKINIDNTPEKEIFFVGIYKTISGEKGRYLAIMRDTKIVKLFIHSGFSGYSSIYANNNVIRWYKCMECSDYDSIEWTGSGYSIK